MMLDEEALHRLEASVQRLVSRAVTEAFAAFRAEETGQNHDENPEARQFNLRIGPLLHEMLRQGGSVHRTELSRLGQKYYGSPRGMGGFATGANPSISSEGDMRKLTERGRALAEGWWETYGKHRHEHKGEEGS